SNTFALEARYGRALKGGLSTFNQYSLGGFLNLSAYRPGELLGQAVGFGRLSYYRRLGQFSNPFGRSMYAGLSAEFARISDVSDQLGNAETRNSFGAFVGIDTLIGPLYLGYGRARERTSIFYLFLGQP
ncbi:MAG: esterase, partial [Betaproteobacteria bacterium]